VIEDLLSVHVRAADSHWYVHVRPVDQKGFREGATLDRIGCPVARTEAR